MFNTYGYIRSKKLTTLPEREVVEDGICISNITAKREPDSESMRSVRLEFAEPREGSPNSNINIEKTNEEVRDEEEGVCSGVEIKVNLSAFDAMDEAEKDTAL